jgi:hypothetical protein
MTFAGFDPSRFSLQPWHFEHQSMLHGIRHTYRVMTHCLILGEALEMERERRLAFCAAYVHDMSRLHDGYCTAHGEWASSNKLPVFTDFFLSQGLNFFELEEIAAAVKNHSEGFDLKPEHEFYKTTALLKDADALDRIRLGDNNLDVSFLRFNISHSFIPFAVELYRQSEAALIDGFSDMHAIAVRLASLIPVGKGE